MNDETMEIEQIEFSLKYVKMEPELFLNPKLNKTDCLVFCMIEFKDGENHCWASNKYIADFLDVSSTTVSTSISRLKDEGYIREVSFDGRKRVLKINPDYKKLKNEHIRNLNDRIKDYLYITKNRLKDNSKKENKDTNVSLPVGNGQAFSDKSGDKEKSYKVDMTAYSPDVQNLYDLWRNLGSPIKQHRNGSKTNHDAICALKKAVKLHDPDKIANAMLLYHKIISSAQDYKLSMRAPGHLIGLNEFFRFSDFTRSRIDKKNCAYDIQSWFDECMKGEVYIDRIYAKHKVENTDPEITTQLKKYWKTYISKEVPQSPGDEDCFRLAATKFRKFIKKNRNNVALHDNIDINNLPRDSKYLYEAIIEKTDNLKIVTPAWLCSDVMFKKRFPSYLYHQGMMDNDFDDDDDDQSDFVNQLHEMYGG
jgi:DNA-binding MarR family transcriptional regulator